MSASKTDAVDTVLGSIGAKQAGEEKLNQLEGHMGEREEGLITKVVRRDAYRMGEEERTKRLSRG